MSMARTRSPCCRGTSPATWRLPSACDLDWLLLQLRVVNVQIGLALNSTRWAMTAIDQFGFLLLGLLWLIAFFVIEAYLRQGVPTNRTWISEC